MSHQLIGHAAMLLHFGFLAYVVLGGFLAWRWRWSIWVHAVAVGWGVSIVTVGQECPLTHVENWARRAGGGQDLPGGFIETYLTGVIYPAEYLEEARALVAAAVVVSWVGWWWRSPARRRTGVTP